MKLQRTLSLLAITVALAAVLLPSGCKAQAPPPTTYNVALTWTNPSICTASNQCAIAIYKATITTGSCPASTSTAYSQLVLTGYTNPTTTTDTATASGSTECYIAEALQIEAPATTPSYSGPSNTASVVIPAVPTAPVLGTPAVQTIAKVDAPANLAHPHVGAALESRLSTPVAVFNLTAVRVPRK